MASFKDKVIAITGGASGMGLATANLLAQRGALLSLADINEAALDQAIASLPRSTEHMSTVVDVCQSATVDTWIAATLQRFGRLDGAVNMAGIIFPPSSIADSADEEWNRTLDVNARGVFVSLRAQIHAMSKGGSIVSAASVFAQMGVPGHAAYSASKAAVIALSRTAAKENPHIRINCVSPGSVSTAMNAADNPEHIKASLQHTIQKRRADAMEVARVILFLLSEETSFVTGAVYNVDGGWIC